MARRFPCSRWPVVALLTIASATAGALASSAVSAAKAEITVSAAISLKDALDEIKQLYAFQNPDVSIDTNYGSSGTLQLQIEQGAPVDVFISAAPKQMDALEGKGLLMPGTRRDLLRNEIVLIVPKDSASIIASFQDLAKASVKQVALGEPGTVPAGNYAKEVLTSLGIYSAVESKAILAKDVRQVLTYVATGNVDAGIVYLTDALSSAKVRVVARAPEKSHTSIVYPVAVIKDSRNPSAARQFAEFLSSPTARARFQKYGFNLASP